MYANNLIILIDVLHILFTRRAPVFFACKNNITCMMKKSLLQKVLVSAHIVFITKLISALN